MARLTEHNGKGMINRDDGDGWQELSGPDYAREQIYQNYVQGLNPAQKLAGGASEYVQNTVSGLLENFGGPENAQRQQDYRADVQQQGQSLQDYGGSLPGVGEFGAAASTAFIPGKLPVQMGIGALQTAAEMPESPWTGAAMGAGFTAAGDWLGDTIGRMSRTLFSKRTRVMNEMDAASIARGEAEGLKFTPGQKTGDRARQRLEKQLQKNPRTAGLDLDRFLDNQELLNNRAAQMLDLPQTGRITGTMRGAASDSVGEAFDNIAENTAPVTILGEDMITAMQELQGSDKGSEWVQRMIREFPQVFDNNQPIDGKQFNQLRNWVAKQSRKGTVIQDGIADEVQPVMRVLDDSLEASNMDSNPMMVDEIRRARQKWKALLVIEASQGGAQNAARGDITPNAAYQALKKYDKGGIFRGRYRDSFSTIVDSMAAAGDTVAPIQPSQGGTRSVGQAIMDQVYTGPAAKAYMQGSNLGEILLGVMSDQAPIQGSGTLGNALQRGLMADDDPEFPR